MRFTYYNANPSHKRVKDCAIRAISAAMNITWEDAMMELARMSCDTHEIVNARANTSAYIKSKNWTKHLGRGKKLKDFHFKGTHLVSCHTRGKYHMTYIEDGVIKDTFNCENFKVDYYFNPPKES